MVMKMCTCINITGKNSYFGRNLDLDYSFNERLIITPSNYTIKFKFQKSITSHYSFIGIGTIIDNYPLYAEASNEKGLSIAGLNFKDNAVFYKKDKSKDNYAPYEMLLLIMATCKNVKEVKQLLNNINLVDEPFKKDVNVSSLHYMISDNKESIVIETLNDKMHIIDNPFNVLTNNPPFVFHKHNLCNYIQLHNDEPINSINKKFEFKPYSYGLGAFGLPGDFSSSSRFVKAFFVKSNLLITEKEEENIVQFFKCLDSVSMVLGCVKTFLGYEYSRYQTCFSYKSKTFYYKTYFDNTIKSISLLKENIDCNKLISFNIY